MTPERRAALRALEERIGHRFVDLSLLDRALTHSSRVNEKRDCDAQDNEPLEFLGDAVLGFLVADILHRRDPDQGEGRKSRLKAYLVSAACLARRAKNLDLPEALALGRGEERSGGRDKKALWVDAYEALVAALYLDGGIDVARSFVAAGIEQDENEGRVLSLRDAKSALQEWLQGRGEPLPDYDTVGEQGPSHRRRFRVQCRLREKILAEGDGFTKKEAQQEAARRALLALQPKSDDP
jgi:ribonuclease-3